MKSNNKIALQQWLTAQLPTIGDVTVHSVTGTITENWLITARNQSWLARYQDAKVGVLGVCRWREACILRRCAIGIGPKVILQGRDWIILEWLVGTVADSDYFNHNLKQLATLVAKLHQRKLSGYPLDLKKRFLTYWQHIDYRRLTPKWLQLHQYFLHTRLPSPLHLAPLHMDIHPANTIITSQGIKLIDWEYAADGDAALELAMLFRVNNLGQLQQQAFLQQYSEQGYRCCHLLAKQVSLWLPWVDYLILLWSEVCWQQSGDATFLTWSEISRWHLNPLIK